MDPDLQNENENQEQAQVETDNGEDYSEVVDYDDKDLDDITGTPNTQTDAPDEELAKRIANLREELGLSDSASTSQEGPSTSTPEQQTDFTPELNKRLPNLTRQETLSKKKVLSAIAGKTVNKGRKGDLSHQFCNDVQLRFGHDGKVNEVMFQNTRVMGRPKGAGALRPDNRSKVKYEEFANLQEL